MEKLDLSSEDLENIDKIKKTKSLQWEHASHQMTEEEVETIKNMNWEWYYNCYLYKDEPLEILCKICGGLNVFLPREKKKKCVHCGLEIRRCEVDEDEADENE